MTCLATIYHKEWKNPLLERGIGPNDMTGIANLIVIIFVAANFRDVISNILKYGIVVSFVLPRSLWIFLNDKLLLISSTVSVLLLCFVTFFIEVSRNYDFQATWDSDLTVIKFWLHQKLAEKRKNIYNRKPKQRSQSLEEVFAGYNESRYVSEELEMKFKAEKAKNLAHKIKIFIVISVTLVIPYILTLNNSFNPIISLISLMMSVVFALKLYSFYDTSNEVRNLLLLEIKNLITFYDTEINISGRISELLHNRKDKENNLLKNNFKSIIMEEIYDLDEIAEIIKFPANITICNFFRYLSYPTLCYQFAYPLKRSRNYRRLTFNLLGIFLCIIAMKIINEQYIQKVLESTFVVADVSMSLLILHIIDRLLNLSIPMLYCWLLMFLMFFHFYLVICAEISLFADESFYEDWWNANSFGEYWRKWNLPVHRFCVRHVYKPLIRKGYSKLISGQIVFLFSAILHEYVIAGALQLGWTGIIFLSFVLQTPLAMLTENPKLKKVPLLGNCIFWISFCLTGQPLGALVFYYLWHIKAGLLEPINFI